LPFVNVVPCVLSVITFLSGTILLFSGATPAAAGRLTLLNRILPLGIIETSHFLGSLVGLALLLLAQGLARRLDAAYVFTATSLSIGIATSLLKGADYEAATILAIVLTALWLSRRSFTRRAALFETRLSAGWIAAVSIAIAASIWLGLFAYRHVEYSSQLWWEFELHGDASRFLRATVGVSIALALLTVSRLLGHAPHEVELPTDAQLQKAARIIERQESPSAFLVYLRDKAILFDDDETAFVMYGVQGRTWVSLAPVGPPEKLGSLIRAFIERCDDFGGVPVFYEVPKEQLYRYADFGLTFAKLGEYGAVDLRQLSLDSPKSARYRQALRRLQKQEATFRVIDSDDVAAVMNRWSRCSCTSCCGRANRATSVSRSGWLRSRGSNNHLWPRSGIGSERSSTITADRSTTFRAFVLSRRSSIRCGSRVIWSIREV
jgi:phosphatidylglycerol lysyltransferase